MGTVYLTHEEYTNMSGKAVSNLALYQRFEYRARKIVDLYTKGRLTNVANIPENIKRLMAELIDLISEHTDTTVNAVSNDGISISYSGERTAEIVAQDLVFTYGGEYVYRGADYE